MAEETWGIYEVFGEDSGDYPKEVDYDVLCLVPVYAGKGVVLPLDLLHHPLLLRGSIHRPFECIHRMGFTTRRYLRNWIYGMYCRCDTSGVAERCVPVVMPYRVQRQI